jgi:transcriptional activator of cad operon
MRLLLCLADRAGEVVSIDELLEQVWAGVVVTPDSVYQAVASLHRMLGDDARGPACIVTFPRLWSWSRSERSDGFAAQSLSKFRAPRG